jgi:DNA-binding beta-propeller fold protein YncE
MMRNKNINVGRIFYYLLIFNCICLHFLFNGLNAQNQTQSIQIEVETEVLPNGWKISPVGKQIRLGDLPMKLCAHPTKKWIAVQNAGQSDQSVMIVSVTEEAVTDSIAINKTFYGMCFSSDGKKLYVSGGNNNRIEVFNFLDGKLQYVDSILLGKSWPNRISPTGLALNKTNSILYVGSKEDSSIRAIDLKSNKVVAMRKLNSAVLSVVYDENTRLVYASEWGASSVVVINQDDLSIKNRFTVGSNPNEIIIHSKSKRLFVACANDNSVHVIDLKKNRVIEKLNTAISENAPTGSTPNGLSIAENYLLVANADNYTIAVFDIGKIKETKAMGLLPAGWYPTQVTVVGGKIFIANGKGVESAPNPEGPNPVARKNQVTYQGGIKQKSVQYIGSLFRGSLQVVAFDLLKDPASRNKLTALAVENIPYRKEKELYDAEIPKGNPIPSRVGDRSPIKHVFYIIKENRTYDQVLSDVEGGDGDTSLLLFGNSVTPNQHKLVKEFVLLDHFYVDAEVSADGHNWSTGAIANDFTEKTWPTSYGGRGGDYVYEGQQTIAHPHLGFIWDHAQRAGISFRTYGEFADDYKPNILVLKNKFCPYFTSWDESVRDTTRFFQWRRDFDSLLAINKVPTLSTLRFINDHTEGVRKGRPTPFAHVADNDLAVGMFIDYLSKTNIWEKSVVFILEDDAQNGPDHIDAHRSTAYVAGGFVKRGYIDHTPYTTTSMLRTIELIIGMKPMSQYDAAAVAMWRCFSDTTSSAGFNHVQANIDLNEKNGPGNAKSSATLMKKSELLNLDKEDVADEGLMNEVLWKYVKGENYPMPPLVRKLSLGIGAVHFR